MKYINVDLMAAASNQSTSSGTAIDASQLFKASFQVVSGGSAAAGTLKIQASNDMPGASGPYPNNSFVPSNWSDITSATVSVSGATTGLILPLDMSYQYIRAVFTSTALSHQTITTVADVAGNLAGKYFLVRSAGDANKYAVWFKVDGSGTAPVVAGFTAEEVDISVGDTAATIATAAAAVINALAGFSSATALSNVITVINSASGTYTAPSNGASLFTGFTFGTNNASFGTISARLKSVSV